jgi:glutaredoxin-related protein
VCPPTSQNKTKTKKIENVQEKIDWASSLRDVKYSLTFLLRKQSESFSEKKLKGSLGNASDSDSIRMKETMIS